jgi:uncharacterized protein YndB with AHSA1/START domain
MPGERDNTAERELHFARLLNAPIELVWKAWTNPEQIKHWWGPDGYTNTILKMDLKPNGRWDLIMHSPKGVDYDIKGFFKEIVKHRKIVYEHTSPFRYVATIEFESVGKKTQLNWVILFESREYLIETAKTFGVEAGLQQNGERLVVYLAQKIFNNK